jgi:hypothetical protein
MVSYDPLSFLRKRSDQMLWQVSWLVFRIRSLPVAGQWHEDRTRVGRLTVAGTASGYRGIPY